MSLKEKEALINEQLRKLNPGYTIANLRLADPSTTRYEFDIVKDFAQKHIKAVERIFQSVVGVKSMSDEIQFTTTIVLPPSAYQKLQKLQRIRRKSQSEIVAELLLNA